MLKVIPICLFFAFAILTACKEKQKASAVALSDDYQKGASLLDSQKDSAYYYFNKVATGSKDSLQVAMSYNNMAVIESDEGDYFGAQEILLASLRNLHEQEERDNGCLASDYNLLGRISQNLKYYDAAIGYYDRALELMKNDGYKAIILNNKGVAYQDKKQFAAAIAIYTSILATSKKSTKEYARVLTNLGMARWQQDSAYPAAPELYMALQLRTEANDEWGLNSSYAHLAEYYFHSRPDSALLYARRMYAVTIRLQSPDYQLEALQKLIELSPAKEVKGYFSRYKHLSDSLQIARNAAKNQFALIRYEAEKNKADNLRLEQENSRQREILFWSIAGLILLGGSVVAWYRRRNRQVESKARDQRLETSQKVHDVVANGLYRMMKRLEYADHFEKENLLDEMEVLYEQSRDISYELPERGEHGFHQRIGELLTAYSGSRTRISIVGNQKDFWDRIGVHAKAELELILQELMTNMEKHSGAQNVLVRFGQEIDRVTIRYVDDGIGFSPDTRYGNGLINTGNRIQGIRGQITFGQNSPKGLTIEMYIPIG